MSDSRREERRMSPGARMLTALLTEHLDPGYAAAARRRATAGSESSTESRPSRGLTVVIVILIGFVLATAYGQTVRRAPEAARTRVALVSDIQERSRQTDALQREAEGLRERVGEEQEIALAGNEAGTAAIDQVRALETLTGLGRVVGPGLTVLVSDGRSEENPVTGESSGQDEVARVQDRDLQDLANALWGAGAEAISVNDQRLSPTSSIRSAGGAILVDFRPLTGPYRLRAIGDPDRLISGFERSNAARIFRGYVKRYGMGFSLRKDSTLRLPAAPAPDLRYARAEVPSSPSASPPTPSASRSGRSSGASGAGSSTSAPDSSPPDSTKGAP